MKSRKGKNKQKVPRKAKKSKLPKKIVEKPFADNTLTSSAFFQMIRSALRKRTMFWKPVTTCRNRQRIPYVGPNKLRKWTYICEGCGREFQGTEVVVHHKIPAGELNSFEDLGGFVKNLFCDSDKLMLVCKVEKDGIMSCHDKEHEKLEKNGENK